MKSKSSKKETYKKVGIGVGLVIVVAVIILLLLRSCGAPANDPGGIEFDPSATEGGWDGVHVGLIPAALGGRRVKLYAAGVVCGCAAAPEQEQDDDGDDDDSSHG